MGKAKTGQGPSAGGRAGEPSHGGAGDTRGQAQWLGWRHHRSCGMTLTLHKTLRLSYDLVQCRVVSQPAATATGLGGDGDGVERWRRGGEGNGRE